MTGFVCKNILIGETVGKRLREARLAKDITLEKAAKDTGIAFKYLESMEQDGWQNLPGRIFLKSFLKIYCEYLSVDFGRSFREVKHFDYLKSSFQQTVNKKYLTTWPRIIRRAAVILVILAVLFFFGFKVKQIFVAPALEVFYPADGIIVKEEQLALTGRSEPEAQIVINNQLVFVDNRGNFKADIDLQKGLNLIKITASKKYGRPKELELRVLLNQ